MLYVDDEDIVSTTAECLATMMAVIVALFEAAELRVVEKKTAAMLLRTPNLVVPTSLLVVEAVG